MTVYAEKKLNVLIITPNFRPNVGGLETHLTDLTEYFRKRNYHVYVITYTPLVTPVKNVPLREISKNIEIHRIKWPGQRLYSLLQFSQFFQFLHRFPGLLVYSLMFILGHEVDVIHAHGFVATAVAIILSKLSGTKTVMSIHGIYNLNKRNILKRAVQTILTPVDRILALSERSKEDLRATGIPDLKLDIYTHWVDQGLFKPSLDKKELKGKLGLSEDFVVLFVGRWVKTKGVAILLEVAKRVPPDVKLVFIGTGPMEKSLKDASEKLDAVRLVGKVSVERLVDYYRVADLVVIPSQDEEGFARVVLEALSCGTPVLAANKGCLPEMIDPSVGVLINPSPRQILRWIMHFRENPEDLERRASGCRAYALERYSERNAELIEKAYSWK